MTTNIARYAQPVVRLVLLRAFTLLQPCNSIFTGRGGFKILNDFRYRSHSDFELALTL
jgi:hypothetical protein